MSIDDTKPIPAPILMASLEQRGMADSLTRNEEVEGRIIDAAKNGTMNHEALMGKLPSEGATFVAFGLDQEQLKPDVNLGNDATPAADQTFSPTR